MMMLVIQLGLILFAARLGNILFEKLKLPGPLGELTVGMIIGPYALGQIGVYGFPDGLFPYPVASATALSPELSALGAVAAVVLLFTVGLETDLKLLLRYSLAGGLVGLGGMVVSFFLGAATVTVFSEMVFGRSLGLFAPECLLLGTITTATSVGITARVLAEQRQLDSPEGVTILSAAVIDDVMGIILLAVIMSVVTASKAAGGVDWAHVGLIAAKAVTVWLAATIVGLVASRRISVLLKWFGERTSIAIMAFGLALILAGLFEEAGLAMIIGAYVMGLALSRADISRVVQEELHPIYAFLVPVFFCTTGMQINLGGMLGSSQVMVFGFAYALVALAAKVVGCGLPALAANFNLRGAARIGFGMAPRCEVALIIAGVGLSAGLLSPVILAAVIIMVVVNTLVAPPALAALLRSPKRGTRKPAPDDGTSTTVSFDFPSIEMTEFFAGKLAAIFEADGFFVHQISPEQRLFQLRKDKTVIDFCHAGTTLTFNCHPADAALVNAAIEEALAAQEQAIRQLRKPLDSSRLRGRLSDQGPLGPLAVNLRNYLTPDLVEPDLKGVNKEEIMEELLGILAQNELVQDLDAARQALWQRERSMSTGLQYGVAIPHGRTDSVPQLVCAVGITREGVDFDSMDGEPSRIFVITLSPQSKPAPHIQFMSTISQILNSAGRERVLACQTASEICGIFVSPPPEVRRPAPAPAAPSEFSVADYLRPELLRVDLQGNTKDEVIRELLVLLDGRGFLRDIEEATRVILDREAQSSTGLEHGIAIPHGRTDAVENMVCAIGLKRDGLDFGAIDKKPTNIIILVLTPETGAAPYLQFVASLMRALDEDGRRRVLSSESNQSLWEALTGKSTK